MYPERRPYATTTPHSGYCAKPLTPTPPSGALKVLRSYVGYDDTHGRRSLQSDPTADHLAALLASPSSRDSSSSDVVVPGQPLLPPLHRTPEEVLENAQLEDLIEHEARTFHGCQQAVLNAELRNKVEKRVQRWSRRLSELQRFIHDFPTESSTMTYRTTEGLSAYLQVYRCTEPMHVSSDEIIEDHLLQLPQSEVDRITAMKPVRMDEVRHVLDDMLESRYLLAPLEDRVEEIDILDSLAHYGLEEPVLTQQPLKDAEEEAAAVGSLGCTTDDAVVAAPAAPPPAEAKEFIYPSRTAAVLHETLHYNPGAYAERELMKSDAPLADLDARVMASKTQKEQAIDGEDPVVALRSLHAQVDYSNDLLLLEKARMALVALHTDDVKEFSAGVVHIIAEAQQSSQMVQHHTLELIPKVAADMSKLFNEVAATEATLKVMEEVEVAAEEEMRGRMRSSEEEASAIWTEILSLVEKLEANAAERSRLAGNYMSLREQRAKETAMTQAVLKAQQDHLEHLNTCDLILGKWKQVGELYGKYVDACIPKLLKHVAALEEADDDLNRRESQDYVRRYELFAYAAEEARAKRNAQIDRMDLLLRNTKLSQERAAETLDPDVENYLQRAEDATREMEEVQLYLSYLNEIAQDRRSEVDPVLFKVLSHNPQALDLAVIADRPPTRTSGTISSTGTAAAWRPSSSRSGRVVASPLTSAAVVAATPPTPPTITSATATAVPAAAAPTPPTESSLAEVRSGDRQPVAVAHPMVSARRIGLLHEEAYMEKQVKLTDKELQAAEKQKESIRHTREELREMESKYRNGEEIRKLLGLI